MILLLRVATVSAVSLRFLRIEHMAEDVRFYVAVRRSASRPGPQASAFLKTVFHQMFKVDDPVEADCWQLQGNTLWAVSRDHVGL